MSALLATNPSLTRELELARNSNAGFLSRFKAKIGGVWDLLHGLDELTDEQIHALGGIEAVKAMVGSAFDTYIAPIDIPFIPNILEATVVDPLLRKSLLWACDELHERIHHQA